MATDGGARCAVGTAHLHTAVPSAVAPAANPSCTHAPPLPPCCPSQAAGDQLQTVLAPRRAAPRGGSAPDLGHAETGRSRGVAQRQTIVGPKTGTFLRTLALGDTDADLVRPLWLVDKATGGMVVLGAALDGGSVSARTRSQIVSPAQLRALMGAQLGMASFWLGDAAAMQAVWAEEQLPAWATSTARASTSSPQRVACPSSGVSYLRAPATAKSALCL